MGNIQQRPSFDKNQFSKFDRFGREAVKRILSRHGFEARDNPDRYGVDLILYKDGKLLGYADVEVRPDWKGPRFPFNTIHAIVKKVEVYSQMRAPVWYFSVHRSGAMMKSMKTSDMLKYRKVFIRNKRTPAGEWFYDIPVKDWKSLS